MFLPINDTQLHCKELNPTVIQDEQHVLIFLHEALGSIGQWKAFPEELCERLQLRGFAYERQGHGLSSSFSQERDEHYLHNYALQELPEVLDYLLKPGQRAILIGHSDGGTISLLCTAKHPERIAGVVTMAAHVINEPETVAGIAPSVRAFEQGKLKGLHHYHGDKTRALFYAWADIWRSGAFADWDISQEIACAGIPGLFIQGQDDQYGTEKQLALIQKAYGQNGNTLLLADCGHHPHLENSVAIIDRIADWLEK